MSNCNLAVQELALWAATASPQGFNAQTVDRLKQSVRDAVGCSLYCSGLQWSRIIVEAMLDETAGAGTVAVWGTSYRLSPAAAALVNGSFVQGFELDDFHLTANMHGSSTMLPAGVALASHRGGISGTELIAALAVGWEVGTRISVAGIRGNALVRGWHTPTINGTFAAAAVAGRLLRLDPMRMYQCLSLAALHAGGLIAVQYGGMAKRLYAGRASQAGLYAALLANRGFTAPPDVFERRPGGFFPTFLPDGYDINALTRDLGGAHAADGISFKLYAACSAIHPALDAMKRLLVEHQITAIDIQGITVALGEFAYHHVGWPYRVESVTTAQFSIAYGLAVMIISGEASVEQYTEAMIRDPCVLALVARIRVVEDPAVSASDSAFRNAARLSVELVNGAVYEGGAQIARGNADNPATDEELATKFHILAGHALPVFQVDALAKVIDRLEQLPDVREFETLMTPL